jgi:hypothetical protein
MNEATEQTDFEDWATTSDPVREAIGQLLVTIIENTASDSPERKAAMNEALESYGRIKAAMRDRQTLN